MLNTIKSKLVFFAGISAVLLALSVTFSYFIAVGSIKEIMYNDVSTVAESLEKNLNYISATNPEAIRQAEFKKMITSIKLGKSGYLFMMSPGGILTVHPTIGEEGRNLSGQKHIDHIRNNKGGGIYEYKSVSTGQEKIVAFRYIKNWDMWIVPGVNKEDYFNQLKSSFLKWNAILGLVVIGLLLGVATWLTNSITGPIHGMLRIFKTTGDETNSKETRELVCNLLQNMLSRDRK
jgi:methyl-accepting chemotaxis protein